MLSKFSVKKPYTVIVAIVLVVILGFVSYSKMTLDLLPSINMPYAVISTTYSGASPETVEKTVTATLEQSLASVDNVEEVSSVPRKCGYGFRHDRNAGEPGFGHAVFPR